MTSTQRVPLGAMLTVPLMLGNLSCGSSSHDGQPGASGGTVGESDPDASIDGVRPLLDGGSATCTSCPGPSPDAPNYICSDRTTGGPACVRNAEGLCGWVIRSCPPELGSGRKLTTCEEVACGSSPDPHPRCADGSDARPSCIKRADDSCGWTFFCGGVDGPDAGSEPGRFCGGVAALACAIGQYCNLGSTCGAADQGGACDAIPSLCTEDGSPVCGCDDATYSNRCAAAAAEVSVLHAGACGPRPCDTCPGPVPGAPNFLCKDGIHTAGPACVAEAGSACGWQFLECPEEP